MLNVNLISVTPDAERIILYIARVSSNQDNTATGLIGYLIRNGHWSPFEHAHMTLEITTSRAISQQIVRHRSFTFQEFSQRYAEVESDGAIMYTARVRGATNRQSSLETDDVDLLRDWQLLQRNTINACFSAYQRALDIGIAPEVARFLLPMSTRTKLYMTGSVRSWIHYLGDGPGGRTNEHTQKEHREIALRGRDIFSDQFPNIAEALQWPPYD